MRIVALLVAFCALLSGIHAEGQTKTKNVFDIKEKYAPHSTPTMPTGVRPTSDACVPAAKLDDAGEIITLPFYSGCTNEELAAMESTLNLAILAGAGQLRPYAIPNFATMTEGSNAARFGAAQAALAQVRALRLVRGTGIQLAKGSCLSAAEQKDAGAVALFHGYENCGGAQLRVMATLMFHTAFRDVRHLKGPAVKDYHGFTEAGPGSRFAIAKSALALILQTMRRTSPSDFTQWKRTLGNTTLSAQELANPGSVTTLIHYNGLSEAQNRAARATAETALQRTCREFSPGTFYTFTEANRAARIGMARSTLITLDLFAAP